LRHLIIEKENKETRSNETNIKNELKKVVSTLLILRSKKIEEIIKVIKIIAEIIGHNFSLDVLYVARRIAPIAPTDAASVGVANPVRIDPRTEIIKNKGGNNINNILVLSPSSGSLLLTAGIEEGSVNDSII
jgi:hypothetical protein